MTTTPPATSTPEQVEGATLIELLGVIWRRKWVVIVVAIAAAAVAFAVSYVQPKVYEAKADLIYEKELDLDDPLTGQSSSDSTTRQVEMQSVEAIVKSPTLAGRAGSTLTDEGMATSGFELSTETAESEDGAGNTGMGSVVSVVATGEDPRLVCAAAGAYAGAFVSWRRDHVRAQIAERVDAVKREMDKYSGAAKESSDYLLLQQRLHDLQILATTASGNFRVLVPATVPDDPIEPQPLRSALLGLGIGLFAGIGVAFLIEQIDTRVRRPEDVAEVLRQPILGRVPRIPRDHQLVALENPTDPISEAFRLVRTNLAFMDVDNEARVIMVSSSLQGEGKSVTTANLAITMALAGRKVVVVDADLRRPRQHELFGLSNSIGASSVAIGAEKLEQSLQSFDIVARNGDGSTSFSDWLGGSEAQGRLWVLTSGPMPPNPGEIVSSKGFSKRILVPLSSQVDTVLVDSPAMLAVGDTAALASQVNGIVFLVDMDSAKRPVVQAAADQLHRLPCELLGLVVRLPAGGGRGQYYYSNYRYSPDKSRTRSTSAAE